MLSGATTVYLLGWQRAVNKQQHMRQLVTMNEIILGELQPSRAISLAGSPSKPVSALTRKPWRVNELPTHATQLPTACCEVNAQNAEGL
jgi:hypothetical protein